MVYLVDQEEELSDKHKVSLFDESKFEDITIENNFKNKDKARKNFLNSENQKNILTS